MPAPILEGPGFRGMWVTSHCSLPTAFTVNTEYMGRVSWKECEAAEDEGFTIQRSLEGRTRERKRLWSDHPCVPSASHSGMASSRGALSLGRGQVCSLHNDCVTHTGVVGTQNEGWRAKVRGVFFLI